MDPQKKRSKAWDHFMTDGQLAICKECNQIIRHSGSTSNLINHLRTHQVKNEVDFILEPSFDDMVMYVQNEEEEEIDEIKEIYVENVPGPTEVETVNVETACRVCLSDIRSTIHVQIDDRIETDENVRYLDIFSDLSGFDVTPLEPQHFCSECAKNLIMTHELKQKCMDTQRFLDEWVKYEKIIQEETLVENCEPKEIILQEVDYLIEEVDDVILDSEISETNYVELEVLDEKEKLKVQNQQITERFECSDCSSYYGSKKGLRVHYTTTHPELRTHECPHCNKKFFGPFYESHLETCKKAPTHPTICPICGIMANRSHITRHIEASKAPNNEKNSHEKPYKCDICGSRTVAKCGMVSHMQIQHLNQRLRCEVCGVEFKTPSVLVSHLRKYHPEKKSPLKCKICDYTTNDGSSMRRHNLYHTGKKRHKCNICGREFIAKDVWRDHMATHSDARPFPCEICKSAFKTKKALGVHLKTHKEHEYECPVCQKSYLTNQQMRNHVKKVHLDYELPPPGTIFNKNWRIRKVKEEMKELAIKEGVDTAVVESLVKTIAKPPPIEEKLYFRPNQANVARIDEFASEIKW